VCLLINECSCIADYKYESTVITIVQAKMTLIDKLKACKEMNSTIRTTFARFGAIDWKTFCTPLANLSEPEVMALLMNWVTKTTTKNVKNLKLRLRDTTDQEVYEIWIKKPKGQTRIAKIEKCECLKTKILYDWIPTTTYNNLTRAKIKYSMTRADRRNDAKK